MNSFKFFKLATLFIIGSLFFTSCSKDEIIDQPLPDTQETIKKFQKDVEVMSENRQTIATVTIHSDNQALLDTYTSESFNLSPVFNVSESTVDDSPALEDAAQSNATNLPTVNFEIKVIKQEAGATGIQISENPQESRANWVFYKGYITNYKCVRVNTLAGYIKTKFYNRDCSNCPWEHKDTDRDYAGEKATYCHTTKDKLALIYFDTNYSHNAYQIIFFN